MSATKTCRPRFFLARYSGAPADPEEAARQVGFTLLTPPELPDGFSRDEVYLLRLECSTGVQTVYVRKGSEVLALIQHRLGPPVSYGDRPVLAAQVNGKPREITSVGDRLAATWSANGTAVTLIGAADLDELVRLVSFLDQQHNNTRR